MCVKVVAGFHAVVRWQASQARVVMKCVAVLPEAKDPLWHVAHDPATTPVWPNGAGFHAVFVWQESHCSVVTWLVGLATA